MLYRVYDPFVSVDENSISMVTVYPNPASEKLIVDSEIVVNQYEIYTITGAMIVSKPVDAKSFEINLSEIPAGTYFVTLTSDGMVQTKRFVKK